MKAIVQRVTKASVSVDGELVSEIKRGLCIFLGISKDDKIEDVNYMAQKVLSIRLFDDEDEKRWMKSVKDLSLELLCISQFTLYHTWKGNKPDFRQAMPTEDSKKLYQAFLERVKTLHKPELVKDGIFGAMMSVQVVNDGPVTVEVISPKVKQSDCKTEINQNGRQ
ncbi:D-aminoacyl-tRNA deacylase-like isoform X2 [Artemia franciscana]|uniref:D-aminoacyl-tRNA deacylase-like isoform X2 n=1 Tax=Artemia franciscana TaxID=6661 RepID=UPI0032DA81E2